MNTDGPGSTRLRVGPGHRVVTTTQGLPTDDVMLHRRQRTLARPATIAGIGFLTGADVTVRFLPAAEDEGIAFQRLDLARSHPISARVENVHSCQRRTIIARDGSSVAMIEHVMAALAGLQIDNCLIQLDGPEPPGFDGSAAPVVQCLLEAGIVEQTVQRHIMPVPEAMCVSSDEQSCRIETRPADQPGLTIEYLLDYGPQSPIPCQSRTVTVTPETFVTDLAFARTFVLESEVAVLRAQGFGQRLTAKDLLVFGTDGVIENELRVPDECVRHKILDCVGDLALAGCDWHGRVRAFRSGHQLNHRFLQRVVAFNAHNEALAPVRAA